MHYYKTKTDSSVNEGRKRKSAAINPDKKDRPTDARTGGGADNIMVVLLEVYGRHELVA